jgi:Tat protein translocase TatB subunit
MFGIGMPELLIILAVALIVLGPKRLPELARSIGKGLAEFKRSTEELKENLNLEEDLKDVQKDLKDLVDPYQYIEPSGSPPKPQDHQTEMAETSPVPETPPSPAPKGPDV